MHHAVNAYARAAKTGETPRETEASVLMNAAVRLQAICDQWDARQHDLGAALTYNRKVWTILSSGASSDESQLPPIVKQGIVNLGMFVFKRTIDVLAAPAPEKLTALVSINREIAAGLRGMQPNPVAKAA